MKKIASSKFIIGAAFLGLLSLAAYMSFYISKNDVKTKPENQFSVPQGFFRAESSKSISAPKTIAPVISILDGFKLYENAEFGFEIRYPESWQVDEEPIENVRGEQTKAIFIKKPDSDLRFAILPRDGLSYGLPNNGTTSFAMIGGSSGVQTQFNLADGRRLWLLHPQYGLYNWLEDIGRIDIMSSASDPAGDIAIFEKMLSSFKFSK